MKFDRVIKLVNAIMIGDEKLIYGNIKSIIAEEKSAGKIHNAHRLEQIMKTNESNNFINEELRDYLFSYETKDDFSKMMMSDSIEKKKKEIICTNDSLFPERLNFLKINKIILHGPPGTGKTMFAGCLAKEIGFDFYVINISTIVSKYMGETSSVMAKIFSFIKKHVGLYLFDEFDMIGSNRLVDNDVRESSRTTSSLIQLIDHLSGDSILLVATNLYKTIDKAIKRRFDTSIEFCLPNDKQREDYIEKLFYLYNLSDVVGDLTKTKEKQISYIKEVMKKFTANKNFSYAEIKSACFNKARDYYIENRSVDM